MTNAMKIIRKVTNSIKREITSWYEKKTIISSNGSVLARYFLFSLSV